ncbi:hypothetical protein ACFVT5_14245 [Streptomyces sp. NPDC058001]|uniref:hypothetical protein n=1 Tax=Streptomyces sp. NPDC058001 TaxID=3346300 RepID=UPI0036E9B9D9
MARPTSMLALSSVLVAWVLGGCALADDHRAVTSPQVQHNAYVNDKQRRDGIAAQEELLSDGVASKSDYIAAIGNLERCLSRGEISVINHGWNPVNGQNILLWFRNEEADDEVVGAWADQCEKAHLVLVAEKYQEQKRPVMEPLLRRHVTACLRGERAPTSDSAQNLPDLLRRAGEKHKSDVLDCVRKATAELYPDAPVPVG